MYRTVFAFLFFPLLLQAQLSSQEKVKLVSVLQTTLDSLIQTPEIPGISFSLVDKEGIQINLTAGLADIEKEEPLTPNHLLFLGSIGKTYVAALLLKLEEEGLLNMDDPLSKYFGKEPWFDELPNGQDLTLAHLGHHTSGLPRYILKREIWDTILASPDREWTGPQRLAYILGEPPLHAVGRGWAYSDTNYILLGMVIEKVTGRDYYELLKDRILEPNGLTKTVPATQRELPGLASGYSGLQALFGLPAKIAEDGIVVFNPQVEWTGGGLVVTTGNLAQWAYRLYSGAAVSPQILKSMTTPGYPTSALGEGVSYGYGTIIAAGEEDVQYGHSGLMPGFLSIMQYLPARNIAYALQVNTDQLPEGVRLDDFATLLLEKIPGNF